MYVIFRAPRKLRFVIKFYLYSMSELLCSKLFTVIRSGPSINASFKKVKYNYRRVNGVIES